MTHQSNASRNNTPEHLCNEKVALRRSTLNDATALFAATSDTEVTPPDTVVYGIMHKNFFQYRNAVADLERTVCLFGTKPR